MKSVYYKETFLLLLSLLPVTIMYFLWNKLPDEIPTHYGLSGEADDWTKKSNAPYLFGGLSLIIYLLLLVVPKIDPKGRIKKMGNKFFLVKMIVIGLISVMFSLVIISSSNNSIVFSDYYPSVLFLFFVILGNYIQAVQPNYFIGIRTPWTLEDPENWKATHRLGGRLWMFGGLLFFVIAFFVPQSLTTGFMLIGVLLLTLIPAGYSAIYHFQN